MSSSTILNLEACHRINERTRVGSLILLDQTDLRGSRLSGSSSAAVCPPLTLCGGHAFRQPGRLKAAMNFPERRTKPITATSYGGRQSQLRKDGPGRVYSSPSPRSVAFASTGLSKSNTLPATSRKLPTRRAYSPVRSAICLPFGMRSLVNASRAARRRLQLRTAGRRAPRRGGVLHRAQNSIGCTFGIEGSAGTCGVGATHSMRGRSM
jgi:hypothetical protein